MSDPNLQDCINDSHEKRIKALEETQGIITRALGAMGRDVNNLLAWVKLSEKKKAVKIT